MAIRALEPTHNGSYYAIGINPLNNRSIVFKIDSLGNIIWNKKYSSPVNPVMLQSIVAMPDGGFAAGGTSGNLFFMRGDSLGNTIWSWEYDYFLFQENVNTIARTPDNGFMISFQYYHNSQPVIARLDSSGNVVFCKEYRENFNLGLAYNILMSADSNYYAMLSSADNPKTRVLKFDVNGNEIWSIGIGDTSIGSNTFLSNTMYATPDGGCLLGGCIINNQTNKQALGICKISSLGNIEWIRAQLPSSNQIDQATSIANTYDNGFIVTSILADTLLGLNVETRVTKTDSDGHFLWTKKYPINGASFSRIFERPDHGFILAANIFISDWNYLITSVDSAGNLPCGGSDITQVDSTVAMPAYFPLYTQFSHNLDRDTISVTVDSGMIVLDACQLITTPEIKKAETIVLYPNPVQSTAKFFSDTELGQADLKLYNAMGMLIRHERIISLSTYTLNVSGWKAGIYFYELLIDSAVSRAVKFIVR